MRRGVGVNGIIFAEGVDLTSISAKIDGVNAKMPELAVALGLAGGRDRAGDLASIL